MSAVIRKIVTVVEETHIEMGKTIAPPTRRAAAIAVIENPFAGRYVEDLAPCLPINQQGPDSLEHFTSRRFRLDSKSLQFRVHVCLRHRGAV